MAQELAMVTVGVISAMSALAGSSLTWALNNITTTEAARRAERSAKRDLVETHYLSVMSSLENFLRASEYGDDLNRELSSINAVIDLFASETVKAAFENVTSKVDAIQEKASTLNPSPPSISGASNQLPTEWKQLMLAKKLLAESMAAHMAELQSFD